MADIIKALIDGLDKLSDILNIGRLIFYATAGFCAVLPASMCVLLLGLDQPQHSYWVQFMADLVKSCRSYQVWIGGLLFGFVISVVANATVRLEDVPDPGTDKLSFSFLYPKLFSGGVALKAAAGGNAANTTKDYAAWLISEYYRYFEIALFIPYGLMLSLPLYALYSLAYLFETSAHAQAFVLGPVFVAFPLWVFVSVIAWTVFWPGFWVPRVVQSLLHDWVSAKRNASDGLDDFIEKNRQAAGAQKPGDATGG